MSGNGPVPVIEEKLRGRPRRRFVLKVDAAQSAGPVRTEYGAGDEDKMQRSSDE
jgi:hypothetical protein